MDFKKIIRTIPDFPSKGIIFRDITTVLQEPESLKQSIDAICDTLKNCDFDVVVGPESRGFIFGMPVAYNLNKSFVPIRKIDKLPYQTIQESYDLEYGKAILEMHIDAIKKNQKIVIVDDLLATGGTCKAIARMIERVGAEVAAIVFFIELEDLPGREALKNYKVESIVKY